MARILNGKQGFLKLPLDGNGSDIVDGALIAPGTTAGTNLGVYIPSAAAGSDIVGCLIGLHDFSAVGDSSPEDVATHVYGQVEFYAPGDKISIEYDQSNTETADGGSSGTTLTVTSLEDNIDSSWIYIVSGDAIGQLHYVDTSQSGSCTLGSTPTTDIGTSDTFIKILRSGHTLLLLNAGRDQLGTQAAVGTFRANVLYSEVNIPGRTPGWEILDPTKHDGLTGLNASTGAVFRSIVTLANSFAAPID